MSQEGQPHKISLSETSSFEREGFSGQVYVPSEAGMGFNALLVDVHGRHPRKRMIDTARVYFVVKGTGKFTLDQETFDAAEGDLFVIPEGHEYEYEGKMQLLEFNVSPENSFKDKEL